MKLRLVSRVMVVTLVVVVGIIIIIHQHAQAGGTSHPAQPKPTVFVGSVAYRHSFRYGDTVPVVWSCEVPLKFRVCGGRGVITWDFVPR
jgi:hypothetical protein